MSRDQVAEGAQVAQHGGETGEANDWCRLHGLALHPLFRSPTTRYPCGYLPTPLFSPSSRSPPRHSWKRCIYISIYVHRLTHRVCTIPPSPIPIIKGANRFHGTRLRFSSTKRCSLADPSYPRMIKFIRLEIEKLEEACNNQR